MKMKQLRTFRTREKGENLVKQTSLFDEIAGDRWNDFVKNVKSLKHAIKSLEHVDANGNPLTRRVANMNSDKI